MVAWNKKISSNKILAKNKRRKAKTVLNFFTLIIATSVINTRSIIGIVVLTTIIKSSLYNNNNLMLISRKFTFIYDQMRVTTVEIKITLYE